MKPQVDLVLPGLFNLPDYNDEAELPALYAILRFAQPLTNTLFNFETILADCLDINYLAFSAAFTDAKSTGVLCRAVHLKPDMGGALAIPLDQKDDDVNIIINDLSDYFKEDSSFSNLNEGLWKMHLKHIQAPAELPHYLSALGCKLDQSSATLSWSRLMNEMQMYMHAHAVNQRRLQNNQLAINSLWCWGAGEYLLPQRRLAAWYCDDLELKTYGGKAGVDCLPLKTLVDKEVEGDSLVVELGLLQALKSPQNADLPALLESLEYRLFQPLLKAVKAGRVNIRLRAGHEFDFLLSRAAMFKFWRKSCTLSGLI